MELSEELGESWLRLFSDLVFNWPCQPQSSALKDLEQTIRKYKQDAE